MDAKLATAISQLGRLETRVTVLEYQQESRR